MKLNKKQRAELRQMFGGFCAYCGIELTDRFQADHVEPVIRNLDGSHYCLGRDHIGNLYPSCARCNNYKHSMSVEQFRQSIRNALDAKLRNAGFHLLTRFGFLEIKPFPNRIDFWFEKYNSLINGVADTHTSLSANGSSCECSKPKR